MWFGRGRVKHKFDHLGCFIPAMLALGAKEGAVTGEKARRYMTLAEDLTLTCWNMYSRQPSGLQTCADPRPNPKHLPEPVQT